MNTKLTSAFKFITLLAFSGLAACAGSRQARLADALSVPQQLAAWVENEYKPALAAHAAASTPAELTQAIDKLAEAAESAPIPQARAAAERDACLAAAADGDAAVLVKFDCENKSLKDLIGSN